MGKVDINLGIHNRWDIEVIDAKTGEVKQTATGYNVICDAYFDAFSDSDYNWPIFGAIEYGTGTGVPSSSDTGLFQHYGYLTFLHNIKEHVDMDAGIYSITRKYILNPEDAIGIDITEMGFTRNNNQPSSSYYRLYTHAVFTDANGNPIAIHKTDIDIINIYSTFFIHFNPNGYDNGYIKVLDTFNNYNGDNTWSAEDDIYACCGLAIFAGEAGWYQYDGSYYDDMYLTYMSAIDGLNAGCMFVKRVGSYNGGNRNNHINAHPDSEVKDGVYAITRDGLHYTANRIYDNCDNTRQLTEVLISGTYKSNSYTGSNGMPIFSFKPGGSWFSGAVIAQEAVGTGDGVTTKFKTKFSNIKSNTCHVYVDGIENSQLTINDGMPDLALTPVNFIYYHVFPLTYRSTASNPTICHAYKHYNGNKGKFVGYKGYLRTDSSFIDGSTSAAYLGQVDGSTVYSLMPFYNTLYDKVGIKKISYYFYPAAQGYYYSFVSLSVYVAFSNDLENWITIVDDSRVKGDSEGLREFEVPLEYQHYKFMRFKIESSETSSNGDATVEKIPYIYNELPIKRSYTDNYSLTFELTDEGYDIVFDTPPAEGAVITADYTSLSLAKDSDHVFDFEFTINLNEYTGS